MMLPDFGMPGDDAVIREALRAIEMERIARAAYERECVARDL